MVIFIILFIIVPCYYGRLLLGVTSAVLFFIFTVYLAILHHHAEINLMDLS